MLNEPIKCIYCASPLQIPDGAVSVTCSFCGQRMHIPSVPDDTAAGRLICRGFILLDSGDFNKAGNCFDRALDISPEHPRAYVGLLCVQFRARSEDEFAQGLHKLEPNAGLTNYDLALRFADDEYRTLLTAYARVFVCRQQFLPVEADCEKLKRELSAYEKRNCFFSFTPPHCRTARELEEYQMWVAGVLNALTEITDYRDIADVVRRGQAYSRALAQSHRQLVAYEHTAKGFFRRIWFDHICRGAAYLRHAYQNPHETRWLGTALHAVVKGFGYLLVFCVMMYLFIVTGVMTGIVNFLLTVIKWSVLAYVVICVINLAIDLKK